MIAVRSGRGSGRRRRAAALVAAAAAGAALVAASSSSATAAPSAPAAGGDFWAPSRSDRGEVQAQPWSDDAPTAVLGRG